MSKRKTILTLVFAASLLPLGLQPQQSEAQWNTNQLRNRHRQQSQKVTDFEGYSQRLRSDDPSDRLDAVRALGKSNDPKALEFLIEALGDKDLRVRVKAIEMLGELRARDAAPVLIQQLFLRTNNAKVKQRILAALAKIGDPQAAKPIMEFLRRDLDKDTRGNAIYALGDIGAIEAESTLKEIAESETDATLKRLATEALTKVSSYQAELLKEAKAPARTFLAPEEGPPGR